MWYYLPNRSSTSAPGEDSSDERLHSLSLALSRSATWNTKSAQPKTWLRVLKTVPFMRRRSGRIFTPSMLDPGADGYVASLAVIPVSPSALPASGSEPLTRDISGLAFQTSFEMLSQPGASSRTCQGMCDSDCARCDAIFEAWVTRFTRASTRRQKSARPTSVSASSSWPTATGQDSVASGSSQPRTATHHPGTTLPEAIKAWATPGANEDAAGRPGAKMQQMLKQQAELFHPSLQDQETGSSGGPSSPSGPTSPQLALLEWIASWWREPLAALCEASLRGGIAESAGELHEERLEALLTTLSSRRQLNPRFAEWLMGWEPGWTSLAPLDSASSETALYLSPPPSPSPTSGDNWPTPDTPERKGRDKEKGGPWQACHEPPSRRRRLVATDSTPW